MNLVAESIIFTQGTLSTLRAIKILFSICSMYVGTLYVVYLQTIWQTFTANLGSFANVFVEKLFQLDSYLFKKVNVRTDIEKAKIFLWKFI